MNIYIYIIYNICTYAWKCICKLCNICKGFASIWVKGGSPTKIAALSSSLWPLNSWNTKGLCHFQPQEVSQPSHFFEKMNLVVSSSKPLPSYGNVHEFSRFEIDSGKTTTNDFLPTHQRFPSLRCPAGAGCDPGMTSNEVGGTAGTAAASPFLVDASAGAGASIFRDSKSHSRSDYH